ncbi:unnamed protein product [Prunus armeniaca]|uniref:LOB domain-containing protein n=1 Tax=Prunus armeniaca TaxID=36596 RepID=A0A6J5U885_PRUAR|nr:unnamed protein product [Prunus armeniaca]
MENRHQRRKCDVTCEMAPYFPASRYSEFQNAHKIFGVSNIQKIRAMAAPDQRQAAAESILKEGNAWKVIDTISCNEAIKLIGSNIKLYKQYLKEMALHVSLKTCRFLISSTAFLASIGFFPLSFPIPISLFGHFHLFLEQK